MTSVDKTTTFPSLLERIVRSKNAKDSRDAWDELTSLAPRDRLGLLVKWSHLEGGIAPLVVEFLYKFGFHFPDETVEVLRPFADKGYFSAWQVFAAQFARGEVVLHGQHLNPFLELSQLDGTPVVHSPPSTIGPIERFLESRFLDMDSQVLLKIIETLATAEASFGFAFFSACLLESRKGSFQNRLIISLAIKMLAKPIRSSPSDRWVQVADKVASIVASFDEDRTIRLELAYTFRELPTQQGITAVEKLIQDAKRDGRGSAYIPALRDLIREIRIAVENAKENTAPALTSDEIISALLQYSRDPQVANNPHCAEALSHGSSIQEEDGSEKQIKYSKEVVERCLAIIPSMMREESVWCLRYLRLLVSAVSFNGPPESAARCIDFAAKWAIRFGRCEDLEGLLDIAAVAHRRPLPLIPLEVLRRLGVDAQLGGANAESVGRFEDAEAVYTTVARVFHDLDPKLEGGALLAVGTMFLRNQRNADARSYLQQAVSLFERARDAENHATALMRLGILETETREFHTAQLHLNVALHLLRTAEVSGRQTKLAYCLSSLIELEMEKGTPDISHLRTMIAEGLQLARETKDDDLENTLLQQKRDLGDPYEPQWEF